MEPDKPFLVDPWRNLRRSGAFGAWFATLFYAVPIGFSLRRNAVGGGDRAHLIWTVGVAIALVAASIVGVQLRRTSDRNTQWVLTAVCWALVIGAVASVRLVTGGDR